MRMPDDRVKSTSSSRDDRRKHDDYQRDRDRDRDRERERDRGDRDRDRRRDDRYRVERYEKDRRRHEKDYDRRRRSRSRSKSRGDRRRHRSKSKSRSVEKQRSEKKRRERSRSHDKAPPKDNDRKKRALSIEIEKELENLRRMSDLKAAKRMNDESLLLIPPPPPKFKESSSSSSSSNSSGSSDEDSRKKQSKEKPDFMRGDVPKVEFVKEIETEEERIEFQQKMQEKLQRHLASQGKVYPPPKHGPEINHATGFANDGSFLEMFKRMQEQQQEIAQQPVDESTQLYQIATGNQNPIPVPFVGRRRGGKILKTGLVKKAKAIDETAENPNDAWNVYLQEVKKYKNASCDADSKTRPLVK